MELWSYAHVYVTLSTRSLNTTLTLRLILLICLVYMFRIFCTFKYCLIPLFQIKPPC
jgi:hypothetical protein